MGRFQGFALFRVNNNDIGEDFRKFLSIEKLRSLLLISRVIDVKSFSIVLKNLLEFADVS